MRERRRRAMRAAVLGVFGVLVLAPGAHAATCVRTGGSRTRPRRSRSLPADGTVTLSQDDAGALLYAVGAGAPRPAARATLATIAQINAVGSAAADTLVVDLTAGLLRAPSDEC